MNKFTQEEFEDLTAEGFAEFVCEQPDDKEIEHTCGWECCAIGEYLDSQSARRVHYADAGEFAVRVVKEKWPQTYKMMNVGQAHDIISTYGGLCRTLNEENPHASC